MAKKVYIGINNVAQQIKKIYVGVDGKAQRVKKMYIGDANGKAQLCYVLGTEVTLPSQSGTLTYTGSQISPTWSTYTAAEISTYFTVTGNTGTNVGSYTATFTPKDGYLWADNYEREPRTQSWSISKVTPTVSITLRSATNYSGSAITMTTAASTNFGTLQIGFGSSTTSGPSSWTTISGTTTSISQTNAGTYYIWYKVTGNDNVNSVAQTYKGSVTINKVAASVTKEPAAANKTYSGSAQNLMTAGTASGGTIQYGWGSSTTSAPTSWGTTVLTGTNAGSYYLWRRVVGDANHTNVAAKYIATCTMAKATPTVTLTLASGLTYSGSAQQLITNGSVNVGTLYLQLGANDSTAPTGTWQTSATVAAMKGTNAATYYVWYKVTSNNSNYNDIGATYKGTATIAKRTVNLTWSPLNHILWYTGSACTATASTGISGLTVTYTGTASATNPGSYTATATLSDTANNQIGSNASWTWHICVCTTATSGQSESNCWTNFNTCLQSNAAQGQTIYITASGGYAIGSCTYNRSGAVTVNFNGNTVHGQIYSNAGTLTLTGSGGLTNSTSYTDSTSGTDASVNAVVNNGGTVKITGGTYTVSSTSSSYEAHGVKCITGTTQVSGGTFSVTSSTAKAACGVTNYSTGVAEITGGTFTVANTSSGTCCGFYTQTTSGSSRIGTYQSATTPTFNVGTSTSSGGTGSHYGVAKYAGSGTLNIYGSIFKVRRYGSTTDNNYKSIGVLCKAGTVQLFGDSTANGRRPQIYVAGRGITEGYQTEGGTIRLGTSSGNCYGYHVINGEIPEGGRKVSGTLYVYATTTNCTQTLYRPAGGSASAGSGWTQGTGSGGLHVTAYKDSSSVITIYTS